MEDGGRQDGPFTAVTAWSWLHWLAVALALAIGTAHVALGLAVDETAFFLAGGVFYLGTSVFFTPYWRTVFYPLAALYTLALGVLWLFDGRSYVLVGALNGIVSVAFVVVVLVLFAEDEAAERRVSE